jgi:hypothetical protein
MSKVNILYVKIFWSVQWTYHCEYIPFWIYSMKIFSMIAVMMKIHNENT